MNKPKSIFDWQYTQNPANLPVKNIPVYCFIEYTEGAKTDKGYSVGYHNGTEWVIQGKAKPFSVLAWCKMEPGHSYKNF